MAEPDGGLLFRCNVTWSLFNQNCINSFFFRSSPAANYTRISDEVEDLHNQFQQWCLAPMRECMSSNVHQVASIAYNLNGDQPFESVKTYIGTTGTVVSDSMPSMIAGVMSWRTAYRGRRLHSRNYICGVPVNGFSGNRMTDSLKSKYSQWGDLMLSRFGVDSGHTYPYFVSFSRKNGTNVDPLPVPHLVYLSDAGLPVVRYVVDEVLYTQRKRLEGRGI